MFKTRGYGRSVPESTFITLSSYSSHEYFEDNTNQKFSNHLVNEINCNDFPMELGLVELFYEPGPEVPVKIFGHEPDDNKITIVLRQELDFQVAKKQGDILDFIQYANAELKKFNIKIEFHLLTLKGVSKFVMYQNEVDRQVAISQEYAQALGFTLPSYSSGRHEAKVPYSQADYDQIDLTHKMRIVVFKDDRHDLTVNEPAEPDIFHLITEINTALEQFQITLTWNGEKVFYENEHRPGAMTRFSSRIEKIFNIPSGHLFVGKEESFPSFSDIDLGTKSNFVAVKCKQIAPQTFNGRLFPILKLFQKQKASNENSQVKAKPNPILYVPLSDHPMLLQNLEIELLNEHLNPLELAEGSHTTAILHLRPQFFQ